MAVYKIAGLTVEYDCIYNTLKQRSEKYLCNETKADIKLRLDDNYFKLKRQTFPDMSDELLEYMGIGTAFYKELLNFGGMMLHASAVAFDDEAYLFAAPSGTGKSTHTQKWTEVFDGAEIINDDKPAVRKIDGKWKVMTESLPCGFKSEVSALKVGSIIESSPLTSMRIA